MCYIYLNMNVIQKMEVNTYFYNTCTCVKDSRCFYIIRILSDSVIQASLPDCVITFGELANSVQAAEPTNRS